MACDVANSVADLWYRLGFQSQADLDAALWVPPADLYQFADEAVKRLAWTAGIFKVFDSSVVVTSGQAELTMPAGHVFTVAAWFLYGSLVQLLRLTNVEQLYALEAAWGAQTGVPTRLSMDAGPVLGVGGPGQALLYPSPNVAGTLCQVIQQTPATVAQGASVVPITAAAQDYFTYAVLATALSKESDHARPEVAAHCAERMKLFEKVFLQYFGPGM
jgi:hypothetical protein